ncbi:MAG: FAD-linked oxidase C-terminal domain-containing protein [Bacteroidota bacterium]|nr:FAD-linked oxidase C-terminal domain-containing protein [Bacteroidota bacterium]
MKFKQIEEHDIQEFEKLVGKEYVFSDDEILNNYNHDETENLSFNPDLVIKPRTSDEISKLLIYCNQNKIPVTPCGARTGLSGGSLPVFGGIVLSMERFNSILEIDERNLQAVVEPGVINQVFQDAVKDKGLFYPPDPASKGSCFLGGNLAENAGGPKALKYGVTKDYVLNIQLVLPTGEVIWTGANVLKNATGYNLTQLIIGSEGTLGIITKIVFKLITLPKYSITMLVPFESAEKACEAVSIVFKQGHCPSALEFMDRDAITWTLEYMKSVLDVPNYVKAHLLIECDGNDMSHLYQQSEDIFKIMEKFGCKDILLADTKKEQDKLWKMRRMVGEAVKSNSIYKEEDTVVPRAELPKLLKGVKNIGKKYHFHSVCYGHAGDGNLHINIIKGDMNEFDWNTTLKGAIREIFELTVDLGGTISGEHGIGFVQKDYMNISFSEKSLNIQRGIKQLFDPNNILNPGKIFPDN